MLSANLILVICGKNTTEIFLEMRLLMSLYNYILCNFDRLFNQMENLSILH